MVAAKVRVGGSNRLFRALSKAGVLSDQGYPGGVDELFDYLNNVMVEKETAESLETQSRQRKQEAVALEAVPAFVASLLGVAEKT